MVVPIAVLGAQSSILVVLRWDVPKNVYQNMLCVHKIGKVP